MTTRTISILGATGSIGSSTLDLVRRNPQLWRVVALTANSNAAELARLAREFGAQVAVVADEAKLADLRAALAGTGIHAAAGDAAFRSKAAAAFKQLADHAGLIMVAHGEATLKQFCSAGIFLHQGKAHWFDQIDDALKAYQDSQPR